MRRLVLVAILVLISVALARDQIVDKATPKQQVDERLQIPSDANGRERYADELTKRFSASWRAVRFHVSGPKNTILHMEDVLVNRSSIDDLVRNGNFVEQARDMGFRRLSFTDGFGQTWNHNIRPRKN
jgi:hypothetical protein